MFSIIYNLLIVNFFFFYFTKKINDNYFKLSHTLFINALFYHLLLTSIYIFTFKDGAADYKTYLDLSTLKSFNINYLVSSDLINFIISVLKTILNLSDYNVITMFSLISFFGIIIFTKNLIKIGVENKIAYILLFIPGLHFWTSVPGKDCLILFFLSCFFYTYIDRKLIISTSFIFLVFLVRPHIGFIFFISVLLTELILIKSYKKYLILLISAVALYALLNIAGVKHFFVSDKTLSGNFLVQMLMQLQDYTNKYVTSDTYYERSNVIFNILNYIFFPVSFLFKNNSFLVNFSIMGEILTYILIIHLILKQKKKFNNDKKLIYFLSICTLIYFLIVPQTLFNFGLNIRQKWMILPFVIYLSFLMKNLLVKINKI